MVFPSPMKGWGRFRFANDGALKTAAIDPFIQIFLSGIATGSTILRPHGG